MPGVAAGGGALGRRLDHGLAQYAAALHAAAHLGGRGHLRNAVLAGRLRQAIAAVQHVLLKLGRRALLQALTIGFLAGGASLAQAGAAVLARRALLAVRHVLLVLRLDAGAPDRVGGVRAAPSTSPAAQSAPARRFVEMERTFIASS